MRLHYRDLPVSVAVTDISAPFEVSGSMAIGGSASGDSNFTTGGGFSYSERPTLSLSILAGGEFQKRLLSPLDISEISLLIGSGWRIDRVLMFAVERLNGLDNANSASGPTPALAPEYKNFREAAMLLEELRASPLVRTDHRSSRRTIGAALKPSQIRGDAMINASAAGLTFEKGLREEEGFQLTVGERVMMLRFRDSSAEHPKVRRLRELLRLHPDRKAFDIVASAVSSIDPLQPQASVGELAIDTRSLMGVPFYLSNGVQTPPEHLAQGLVRPTRTADGQLFEWKDLLGGLINIHASRTAPENAAIAIQHRGYWFFVADDDASTKTTFMLLSELFALQSGEPTRQRPVLTLPAGG